MKETDELGKKTESIVAVKREKKRVYSLVKEGGARGITLIALVVTIIVLLILARSKYTNDNRTKWNTQYSKKVSR